MIPREFRYRWSWTLPADAEALWPLVSDTNRFNRDAGLPPVEDVRAPGEQLTGGRRHLRIRVKGVTLEWEELPFEWYRPWRFGLVRRYVRGPLVELRVLANLEPAGPEATRLTYDVTARPRGLFGLLTTPFQIGVLNRRTFERTFRRYAAAARRGGDPSPTLPTAVRTARAGRLAARCQQAGIPQGLSSALAEHIEEADETTLSRIRPYDLAGRWNVDRREVLVACLRATRAGLLDLRWDVLCPSCLGVTSSAETLRSLRLGAAHCDTCRVDFSPDFDHAVELTFRPNPALRTVVSSSFCVGGPQVTPHVVVQQLLAPGETRSVTPLLVPGRHRLRTLGSGAGPSFLVEAGGDTEAHITLGPHGWSGVPLALAPAASLALRNGRADEALVCVDREAWGDVAVTAAEVTALAEFRDLFSSEVLAAGAFAGVGSVALLFTDLRDSTGMYVRVGDPVAFTTVMRHFDVLGEAIARENGTIVKTIGDAVMAVFPSPAAAVRAAVRAQRILAHPQGPEAPLVLKAAVHAGPSIAVTLNDRLDYFGTTVNVASRLGGLSSGTDVVLSGRVREDPDVLRLLDELGARSERFDAEIRGIPERMAAWRVRLPPGAAS